MLSAVIEIPHLIIQADLDAGMMQRFSRIARDIERDGDVRRPVYAELKAPQQFGLLFDILLFALDAIHTLIAQSASPAFQPSNSNLVERHHHQGLESTPLCIGLLLGCARRMQRAMTSQYLKRLAGRRSLGRRPIHARAVDL
jgi:hypothetical protein